jgi:catechol 2,3-dioxygenase-like lactoylglutathione lyase family enzyme
MQITSHLHTAILVSDLAKSEHFYSNILGLQKVNRTLKFPGIWYQIGEFQLHLIVDPNWRPNLMNQEKLGRNPHLAFAVKDLKMIKKHLEENNCVTQMSASGRAALFTQDPDGNIIELTVPTGS